MLKPLPRLMSDEEAEHFVDTADLSEYDLASLTPTRFVFAPMPDKRVSLRLPEALVAAAKERAASAGVSYQRFVRDAVEAALAKPEATPR